MHAEPPAGFPVSVNTWRWKLDAREVEVALTTFGDAWLLVLTETGTFGTILLATSKASEREGFQPVKTLLGRRGDDDVCQLLARQLSDTACSGAISKQLLLCIGLKHLDVKAARHVLELARQHIEWR